MTDRNSRNPKKKKKKKRGFIDIDVRWIWKKRQIFEILSQSMNPNPRFPYVEFYYTLFRRDFFIFAQRYLFVVQFSFYDIDNVLETPKLLENIRFGTKLKTKF